MASVNKVILLGNLGKDPELKYTNNGKAVCSFSVATTRSMGGKDGNRKEETEWHNIVAWEKSAESCAQYLTKGSQAYIEGRLQTRSYEKDGQTRYAAEVVAERVVFLGAKGQKEFASPAADDEIPF